MQYLFIIVTKEKIIKFIRVWLEKEKFNDVNSVLSR